MPGKPYLLYIDDDYEDVELLHHVLDGSEISLPIVNATNGVEALDFLETAKQNNHLPELILLDINMPRLNGKETFALLKADRQLSRLPVIVVSTSRLSSDIAYFNNLDVPYIVKHGDLKTYKQEITGLLKANVAASGIRHQCIIYTGSPSHKLNTLADTMVRMMKKGYRCLYINSNAMVTEMQSCISAMGINVQREIEEKRLVFSSEPVCAGEDFNIDAMLIQLEASLDDALMNGYKGLWASGDMTWELGSEKNYEKLLEYEWKLEGLFKKRKELQGICQYHYDTLPHNIIRQGLLMHGTVYINETNRRINPHHCTSEIPSSNKIDESLLDEMISEICKVGTA